MEKIDQVVSVDSADYARAVATELSEEADYARAVATDLANNVEALASDLDATRAEKYEMLQRIETLEDELMTAKLQLTRLSDGLEDHGIKLDEGLPF